MTGWNAVPQMLVRDNEAGIDWGRAIGDFAAFAGLLATRIHFRRPGGPEAEGPVERAIANRRRHRTPGARPIDRWEVGRAEMLALPPAGLPRWWRFATRISRGHCLRVDTCDYCAHPLAIGRKVQVRTDTDEVTVTLTPGGANVARHV